VVLGAGTEIVILLRGSCRVLVDLILLQVGPHLDPFPHIILPALRPYMP
jgi:hypothetical protein